MSDLLATKDPSGASEALDRGGGIPVIEEVVAELVRDLIQQVEMLGAVHLDPSDRERAIAPRLQLDLNLGCPAIAHKRALHAGSNQAGLTITGEVEFIEGTPQARLGLGGCASELPFDGALDPHEQSLGLRRQSNLRGAFPSVPPRDAARAQPLSHTRIMRASARAAAGAPERACATIAAPLLQRAAGSGESTCPACPQSPVSAPQRRRDSLSRRTSVVIGWNRTNPVHPDPAAFTRDILPRLAAIPYLRLTRETGLSRRYIKLIATGANIPHPMHWEALRAASDTG